MDIEATRLETNEEVREALARYRPAAPVQRHPTPADDGPPLFKPTARPSMPVLTVFDDGTDQGELIRIRKESYVIGRAEGDLVIAYDSQMSARHAELRCTASKDKSRWQRFHESAELDHRKFAGVRHSGRKPDGLGKPLPA